MGVMSKERVLKKLQKLKALAEDPAANPNEAASAAARMTEIMLNEGIAEIELESGETEDMIKEDFMPPELRKAHSWQEVLLNGLAEAAGCKLVIGKAGVGMRDKLWVLGLESTVAGVRYQFAAVCVDIERLRAQLIGGSRSSRASRAFCIGCAVMAARRVLEARQQVVEAARISHNERALVWLQNGISAAKVSEMIGGGRITANGRRTFSDAGAFQAGIEAGKKLALQGSGSALQGEKAQLR